MPRPSDEEISGMTINERLWACGLFDRYIAAGRARDREAMIDILSQVALTREQAAWSVDAVLKDPTRFGF